MNIYAKRTRQPVATPLPGLKTDFREVSDKKRELDQLRISLKGVIRGV